MNGHIIKLENEYLQAWVDSSEGMNVFKLVYKDWTVIDTDEVRKEKGATYGMPILYPTPGRTRELKLLFGDKEYEAVVHGLVRKHPFVIDNCSKERVVGYLDWTQEEEKFHFFPFDHRLTITIELKMESLVYSYCVDNTGNEQMAFGFALHPFFKNENGDAMVRTTAQYAMETDDKLIPSGKLLSVLEYPEYNLSKPSKAVDLRLDTVFYKTEPCMAVIDYPEYSMTMETTEDFNHVVFFTPKDYPYFCIEPQTSSADTFYLYKHGFKEESGLQLVDQGESKRGSVVLAFHNTVRN